MEKPVFPLGKGEIIREGKQEKKTVNLGSKRRVPMHFWSKGDTRLNPWHKGEFLQHSCRAFACKFFFQTHHQGCDKAEKPLSTYVVVHLQPSSDPRQMLMLCGDLRCPSW
ncbi:hypothetical protein TNCV_3368001 [Trichonephila clavipes]|nr:hypothetical protein TNCV_3368001 [Trichonephila clavipes]